ncbi:NucA/NucB deoxyribonuclease domain-containing protein [Actinoplanes regularis]|uniref:Deoxyribonuclease NucA/NucB n=2 Tax=Actinoplanes regularis TaxID=52697 RepID=A0A238XKW2_9ACTN|nr:NucA/NucB deoxyribonuclease domain-containing protein [Actinoplanes regularis]SNR59103.1 Deoxyribonuclease NucA/NucB [Actinoplanes regularis]
MSAAAALAMIRRFGKAIGMTERSAPFQQTRLARCLVVLLTLLGMAVISAPAHAAAGNDLAFVGPDYPISSAARKTLVANMVALRSRPNRAALAIPDVAALRSACATAQGAANVKPVGWVRSRFEQCLYQVGAQAGGIVVRQQTGEPAGEIHFNLWILGVASNGTREVQYHIFVEEISVSTIPGNVIDWPNQRIAFDFFGCAAMTDVTCSADSHVDTVDGWARDSGQVITVTSPNGTGVGPDAQVTKSLGLDLTLGSLPIKPSIQPSIFTTEVRFDSGRGVAAQHGTVFPRYLPSFALSMSDPQIRDSALHIYDAQNRPERTFPAWLGKSVPGKTAEDPLHRMFNEALKKDNRAASIGFCIDTWGPYDETGLDCDEYPFASTQEGAVTGTTDPQRPRSSARLIPGDDNQLAGSRLGAFYSNQRVLDTDAFTVNITP